jgi:F-type H+-transporting ATPase subunit b
MNIATIAVLAAEDGHTEPNGYWLPHDLNEVYWGTIAFLIVMGLLWWKAKDPIVNAMKGRSAGIAAELDQAETGRIEAEAERDSIKAALADSDSEAARIVEEARRTADQLSTDLEAKANDDATALRERAAADLVTAQRQAVADLTAEISRLSLGAAEQVVKANLDDSTQQEMIEKFISQVGSGN